MSILDFMTGGVFTSFKDLLVNFFEWFIRFITNSIYFFINPLINNVLNNIPDISSHVSIVESFFNMLSSFCLYILDFSLLYKSTIALCIGVIIFKITYSQIVIFVKLIVKWWHYLVP